MGQQSEYDIFIGSTLDYEKAIQSNKLNVDEKELEELSEKKKSKEVHHKIEDLSLKNLEPIDDETLHILKRTRTLHPYETVYMQQKLDFYDDFYNEKNIPEEVQEARKLRRIYRDYGDYLNAVSTRNRYIDYLVDIYGGEDMFIRKMDMNMVKDWIPPYPILSKKCPDYDMFLSGKIPTEKIGGEDPDAAKRVLEEMYQDLLDEGLEPIHEYGVEDSIGDIKHYQELVNTEVGKYRDNRIESVTSTDLNTLRNVFHSWYQKDEGDVSRELFYNSPEKIRERYMNQSQLNDFGLLSSYLSGEVEDEEDFDEYSPNDMVYDDELRKPIPYKEWLKREDIRLFSNNGWNKARLMHCQNVGSIMEQLTRKKRPSKKRRRVTEQAKLDIPMSGYEEAVLCSLMSEEGGVYDAGDQ